MLRTVVWKVMIWQQNYDTNDDTRYRNVEAYDYVMPSVNAPSAIQDHYMGLIEVFN